VIVNLKVGSVITVTPPFGVVIVSVTPAKATAVTTAGVCVITAVAAGTSVINMVISPTLTWSFTLTVSA